MAPPCAASRLANSPSKRTLSGRPRIPKSCRPETEFLGAGHRALDNLLTRNRCKFAPFAVPPWFVANHPLQDDAARSAAHRRIRLRRSGAGLVGQGDSILSCQIASACSSDQPVWLSGHGTCFDKMHVRVQTKFGHGPLVLHQRPMCRVRDLAQHMWIGSGFSAQPAVCQPDPDQLAEHLADFRRGDKISGFPEWIARAIIVLYWRRPYIRPGISVRSGRSGLPEYGPPVSPSGNGFVSAFRFDPQCDALWR